MCSDVRRPSGHLGVVAKLATRLPTFVGEKPDVASARARHLIDQMTTAFDDALVENWERHDGMFGLPDPDDEHVVAAALVGGASAIVTENLRHFPITKISPHIKVMSPAEFAADTVSVSPDVALRAVQTMAGRYTAPPLTTEEILNRLAQRYHMTEATELIRAVN